MILQMKILKLVHFFRLRSFARNCARLRRIARVVRAIFCGKKTTNLAFVQPKPFEAFDGPTGLLKVDIPEYKSG